MKKPLLLLVFLASIQFANAAVDLGSASGSTPYDPYMGSVKHVLTHLDDQGASMDKARTLMHEGRGFRYSFTSPYVAATPAETAASHAGDCKAKALWLADKLDDSSVRFVIGKARSSSRMSHAWLMWQHDARWWILDCTDKSEPIPADRVSSSEYIPFYSFAKNHAYRHHATQTITADAGANHGAVAVAASAGMK